MPLTSNPCNQGEYGRGTYEGAPANPSVKPNTYPGVIEQVCCQYCFSGNCVYWTWAQGDRGSECTLWRIDDSSSGEDCGTDQCNKGYPQLQMNGPDGKAYHPGPCGNKVQRIITTEI